MSRPSPSGLAAAFGAYALWGLFPLYFMRVAGVPPLEVVLHRSLWSLLFVLGLLAALRRLGALAPALADLRLVVRVGASAVLLAVNWLIYVWAVTSGRVVEASLGYFINPLVNVLFGVTLLHERLRPAQWLSVGFAAAGVAWLGWHAGQPPWAALAIAFSFGAYGVLRKTMPLGAAEGLALETLLLAPIAGAVLAWQTLQGDGVLGAFAAGAGDPALLAWLFAAGPLTALPLLFFAAAARRLPLATLGLMQYLSPSLQLALGVWVFGEPFGRERFVGFALIWAALALYSADALLRTRVAAAATP